MKIAIIGAAGKTGSQLVHAALQRGWQVSAVCRGASAGKLDGFAGHDGFTLHTAAVISDQALLARALAGCDAVVAVLISVRRLQASALVAALAGAAAQHGLTRLVSRLGRAVSFFTPYSMTDMICASALVARQPGWQWTIVRAPTLLDAPATGYRWCRLEEIQGRHQLSRQDYAASLLDSVLQPDHHGRLLTVMAAAS
ncbi:MAG TPA: NAD(P)H-binding protein [Pseudomonadales bacterium]